MEILVSLILSFIPSFLWLWFFYYKDIKKESKNILALIFLLGIIITFPVVIVEGFTSGVLLGLSGKEFNEVNFKLVSNSILFLIFVGVIEESFKFLALCSSIFRSKKMDEISDGIIYGVTLGLGFAFIESFFYALDIGLGATLVRGALTPIVHASTTAIAGYFYVRAKFDQKFRSFRYIGLLLAIILHSLYNIFLVNIEKSQNALFFYLSLGVWMILAGELFIIFKRSQRDDKVFVFGNNNGELKDADLNCQSVSSEELLDKCKVCNKGFIEKATVCPHKSPIIAAVISIIPGGGQLYLEKFSSAVAIFAGCLVFLLLGFLTFESNQKLSVLFIAGFLAIWLGGIFLAYWQSKGVNKGGRRDK